MIASRLGHREPGLALGLYFLPEAGMVPWPWVALKQRRRRPAERSITGLRDRPLRCRKVAQVEEHRMAIVVGRPIGETC